MQYIITLDVKTSTKLIQMMIQSFSTALTRKKIINNPVYGLVLFLLLAFCAVALRWNILACVYMYIHLYQSSRIMHEDVEL